MASLLPILLAALAACGVTTVLAALLLTTLRIENKCMLKKNKASL